MKYKTRENPGFRLKALAWLLLLTTLLATPAVAQGGAETKIKLSAKTLTRSQVIEQIEAQTAFKVGFVKNNFDDAATIHLGRTLLSLGELLNKLTEGTGNTYTIDNNYILLYHTRQVADKQVTTVLANRTITGTVYDVAGGTPQENITIEVVNLKNVQVKTYANGRFKVEGIPAGTHILRLTSEDGRTIRWREVSVTAANDADVVLVMGNEVMQSAGGATQTPPTVTPGATKTTAYFVPNTVDHTIHAFSDEPKTEYSFVPSQQIRSDYLPGVGIKTNLLILGTTTPNLAVEFALARKWTLDLSAGYNPFALRKGGINKVGFVQPELRYWFCQRFERHFVGLHGIYGRFNVGDVDFLTTTFENHRYKGWGAGGGLSYGYHLPMSKRWALEFTVGAGYVYLEYDKYRCYDCDQHVGKKNKHYIGPTKAGISLIYMIK